MSELIRFQMLRPPTSLSGEEARTIGLALYPDGDLSPFAKALHQAESREAYEALVAQFLRSNPKLFVDSIETETEVVRAIYEWLDFKAKPIRRDDLEDLATNLPQIGAFDLDDSWRRYADKFLAAVDRDVLSTNSRVDFQKLIRVCYLLKHCLVADGQAITVGKDVDDAVVNQILERPIVLPEGLAIGPRRENKDQPNRMKVSKRRPVTEGKPNCQCTCDEECHNPVHHCMMLRPYVGDLYLIREELARYEAGDIADIENVLAGEFKMRRHRVLSKVEESLQVDTETTTSSERDHASTEKSSLQTEVKNAAEQKIHLDAGLTATLKYGESITLTPHANVTADWAKSESRSSARTYSKDLVERAVTKLEEKTRRQQITKSLREVEERNKHSIKNDDPGAKHRAGLYFWVNRISHAQVMNYGRHLMFDLILAEPAATWRALYAKKMAKDAKAKEPAKPSLKPADITPANYGDKLHEFGVALTDDLQPPEKEVCVGLALSQNMGTPENSNSMGFSSHEFRTPELPVGYKAKRLHYDVRCSVGHPQSTGPNDQAAVTVNVADVCIFSKYLNEWKDGTGQSNKEWAETGQVALNGEEGSLTVAVAGYSSLALALTGSVSLVAEPGEEAKEKWRLDVFKAIMTDYRNKLDAYEKSRDKNTGLFEIKGRNPFLNREIERNEIKRHVIAALMCNYFSNIGAMVEHVAPCGYPEIDFAKLEQDSPVIRFFEQVFEWEYLTYLFYHSMWARKCKWVELIDENSGDPLFDKFLTAGAARVQVPVRPGMEKIFLWFLATGQLWGASGQPPLPGDSEYVSMIQELKEAKQGDYSDRPGLIAAVKGSSTLTLTGSTHYWDPLANAVDPVAISNDRDREILIDFEVYRIVDVTQAIAGDPSQWTIILEKPFVGASANNLKHAVGATFVGAPWEVLTPTQLVYLRNPTDVLPVYPLV